jgi:hypothetical protein
MPEPNMNWDYTKISMNHPDLEKRLNRPAITRDSPIDKGVFYIAGSNGRSSMEAIVVDSEKYDALKMLFDQTKERIADEYNFDPCNGEEIKGNVRYNPETGEVILPKTLSDTLLLKEVYTTVKETMRYDNDAVEKIVDIIGVRNNGKIALDSFIYQKVGVCRHMALTCGALIELFKKEGHLNGKPSIDRNSNDSSGHAWCRYTDEYNNVWILDVAQNFCGELKDATSSNWSYKRPEDN